MNRGLLNVQSVNPKEHTAVRIWHLGVDWRGHHVCTGSHLKNQGHCAGPLAVAVGPLTVAFPSLRFLLCGMRGEGVHMFPGECVPWREAEVERAESELLQSPYLARTAVLLLGGPCREESRR